MVGLCVFLSVLALSLLPIAPGGSRAQAAPGQADRRQLPLSGQTATPVSGQGQEEPVRRVIVLMPSRLETTTPQTQHGAEQAAAKILSARKPRGKRRRRLFTLPGAARESAPPAPAVSAPKTEKAAKSGGKASADGHAAGSAKSKPPDTVPVAQRAALAQALFADMVTERVQERLRVAVAAQTEVSAALNALHLTPADIEARGKPENERRLYAALHCQAILIPHVMQCEVKDGLTRDVTCYAYVTISDEGKMEPEGVAAARWPARLDVAGAASCSQVLFHRQYQKPQGDLIRDAAQQAASLLVHALRTGEQAPFMRPADRLAVPPVLAPTQADKLLFTKTGRRVQPSAVRGLDGNVSGLFTPDLLPLSPDRILDASEIMARIGLPHEQAANTRLTNVTNVKNVKKSGSFGSLATLWKSDKNEIKPDVERVQSLARRLGVDYVLLARITDVEVSEGAGDPAMLVSNTTPVQPERAARVEAVAALVRVVDGTVTWQERATSTTTSPMTAQGAAGDASAERSLVHDATRFALIDLERRLRHYRAQFEK